MKLFLQKKMQNFRALGAQLKTVPPLRISGYSPVVSHTQKQTHNSRFMIRV